MFNYKNEENEENQKNQDIEELSLEQAFLKDLSKESNEIDATRNQLILLTVANTKIINNIKLSLAIFEKLNNFTHNNIERILKNEILQNSK